MQSAKWLEKIGGSESLKMQIPLAILCFTLGILLVTQFRTQVRITKTIVPLTSAEQVSMISGLVENNAQLRKEVETLESEVTGFRTDNAAGTSNIEGLTTETEQMKILNGLVSVTGSGVRIVANAPLKPVEVQDLLNELRNSGAEGMSLNEHRVVARSSVMAGDNGRCIVDGIDMAGPYVFEALGEPDTLQTALERKGGMLSLIRYNYGEDTVRIYTADDLVLPVYEDGYEFTYAKPVKE